MSGYQDVDAYLPYSIQSLVNEHLEHIEFNVYEAGCENWQAFNGQKLHRIKYNELCERLLEHKISGIEPHLMLLDKPTGSHARLGIDSIDDIELIENLEEALNMGFETFGRE